jgi:hypothetical protein
MVVKYFIPRFFKSKSLKKVTKGDKILSMDMTQEPGRDRLISDFEISGSHHVRHFYKP